MVKERRYFIMLYSIMVFIISTLPSVVGKFLLFPEGSLKIIGPVIGFFLAFGIYYKWKHIEKIYYFIFGLTIGVDLLILLNAKGNFLLFMLILLVLHALLLIVFFTSQNIKTYLGLRTKF